MKKMILMLLLLLAVALYGCDNAEKPKEEAKPSTPVTQQAKELSFIVYRAAADGTEYLLPEKITMQDNGKTAAENALIALVGTKPQDARYDDVFPIGTKVRSLKIEQDGTAVADFSKEIVKKGMGAYDEMMICYAITNTLTEFPEIKRVRILVEGKQVSSLGGQMDLEDALVRNPSLLKK